MDIAIIGGGAAGFMAAIMARRTNPSSKVTIFERAQKVLAKVEITGGGRCNVTNSFATITDMKQAYPRGYMLMKRLMKTFSHEDTFKWFEQHGVPLVTQEDECVFPKAQDSHAIIDCLVRQANELGVTICCRHRLVDIHKMEDGRLKLEFDNSTQRIFHRTIITTGGSPNGRGLHYLERLGHKIEAPIPSLFTFNIKDRAFCDLMGTVVDPVVMAIPGTKLRAQGALLVTHWGVSGPAALKLSSYAARLLAENDYKAPLAISWTAFREEFVTCGGVSLSSVNSKTLESKVCPNLFFAGEVLDIDAITGGFNLQAAWTTGFIAGKSASLCEL